MRFHHQASSAEQANHEHQAHQHYHRAEQSKRNTNTRPDDTARKKPEQHRQRTLECIQTTVQSSVGEFENRLNHRFDGIEALLVGITSQLRLTMQKQRDDMDKSFRQIFYGNTDSNTDNDDTDSNTDNDVDKSDSEQETDDDIDDSDDDSVSNADVAPSSHTNQALLSPGTRSPLEEFKDPFVKALTKRHSLTQLHEWLRSIKSSVSNSVTVVTSHHLHLHITSQLTVTELLSTLPFSTQLNRGHHHLGWSGFAKYENFKPWKTKRSFQLRHPHCWFASLPQLQQIHLRSTTSAAAQQQA